MRTIQETQDRNRTLMAKFALVVALLLVTLIVTELAPIHKTVLAGALLAFCMGTGTYADSIAPSRTLVVALPRWAILFIIVVSSLAVSDPPTLRLAVASVLFVAGVVSIITLPPLPDADLTSPA